MQQTEKYKLNLIESSDTFLPDALNANTQKVEDVLATEMEGPVANLEARVTVLEAHKFVCGSYKGSAENPIQFIPLPFTPKAVLIWETGNIHIQLYVEGAPHSTDMIFGAENGFRVSNTMNPNNVQFRFIAFC